jgi:hypothetical protein
LSPTPFGGRWYKPVLPQEFASLITEVAVRTDAAATLRPDQDRAPRRELVLAAVEEVRDRALRLLAEQRVSRARVRSA